MVATWSDSDASANESYDDEVANLCLMTLNDSKVTFTLCDSNAYYLMNYKMHLMNQQLILKI